MSNKNEGVALGLDVGGTSVSIGAINTSGELIGPVQVFNPHSGADAETIIEAFVYGINRLMKTITSPILGIGMGMPGPFDYEQGISRLQGVAKYDAIYGINLGAELRDRVGIPDSVPLRFINDAVAFALGEWAFGSARQYQRVMTITLGTGCGSAFLDNGKVLTEGQGVPSGGYVFSLPLLDTTIDEYISRRGILRLWGESFAKGTSNNSIDVFDLAKAAEDGDPSCISLFEKWGELMVSGLAPVIRQFQPDCILMGGAISKSLQLFSGPLESFLSSQTKRIVIVKATEHAHSAIRGAAKYALQPKDTH